MRAVGCALVTALAFGCGDPPDSAGDDAAVPAIDAGAGADARPIPDAAPPIDAPNGPDITVNANRAIADFALETQNFAADACELTEEEDCVAAPGDRRLLRFAVETPNLGNEDLYLGAPRADNPNFVWSPCHEHWHFEGYAEYNLVDGDGNAVAEGRKQAFCLLDSEPFTPDAPDLGFGERYNCQNQGIHAGWSDVYHARLPCQYLDVTDVPDGSYTLVIELNTAKTLTETNFDNNRIELPVTIGDDALKGPTDPCPADMDAHSSDGTHRECGWTLAGTYDCEPGGDIRVGCNDSCGGTSAGSCTGDPVMRVCDAANPTGNCTDVSKIAADDDACGTKCPRIGVTECPASGQVAVYHGPFTVGDAYTCTVEVDAL